MACCVFNENNPEDYPLMIKVTRGTETPRYIVTKLSGQDDYGYERIYRSMYLGFPACKITSYGVTYESFNVRREDLEKFIREGKLPEGTAVWKENQLLKNLFWALTIRSQPPKKKREIKPEDIGFKFKKKADPNAEKNRMNSFYRSRWGSF